MTMRNDFTNDTTSFGLLLHTDELSRIYPSANNPILCGLDPATLQQSVSYDSNDLYEPVPAHQHAPEPPQFAQHGDSSGQFFQEYNLEPLGYSQPPSLPSYPAYSGVLDAPMYQAQGGAIPQQLGAGGPMMDDAFNTWSTAPSFYG